MQNSNHTGIYLAGKAWLIGNNWKYWIEKFQSFPTIYEMKGLIFEWFCMYTKTSIQVFGILVKTVPQSIFEWFCLQLFNASSMRFVISKRSGSYYLGKRAKSHMCLRQRHRAFWCLPSSATDNNHHCLWNRFKGAKSVQRARDIGRVWGKVALGKAHAAGWCYLMALLH